MSLAAEGASATLIAIARILTTEPDLTEALRRVAREIARFVGAETASVHLLDRERRVLVPVAAYKVPKDMLPILGTALLPLDQQGFAESAFAKASVTWSDDVQSDPRFTFTLFRQFVHRSGVVVPVQVDGHVAGAFYLVWWERARRFADDELAMLEAVGQQVALLLRSAWLLQEARRRTTQAEDAERRYRQLVENVPIGIYRTTMSGQFVDVNPGMLEILRFPSREAMLASNAVLLYVDPADRLRGVRHADATGAIRNFDVELRLGDGTRMWGRINARRVKLGDEEFLEGTLQDITAARRAAETEQRYRELFNNVPVGIFRTTADGRVIDVNPTLVETLRYPSREAMIAQGALALYVNQEDRARGQRLLEENNGVVRDFEVELRAGDGTRVWVRMSARRAKDGNEVFHEGTIEDITLQRRVEAAERRAEALRAVTLLAGAAAHEINNPLAIITGRLELLRARLGPAEQQRLQPAFDAAKRITGIITDMGRITRLEVREDFGPSTILDLHRSGQPPRESP